MSRVLMTLRGSMLLSNSWKQQLVLTEDGAEGEVLNGFKRRKMSLPYDRIAQVNLVRGVLKADLELVNKGGADNLLIRALSKSEAEEAKALIEQRMRAAVAATSPAVSPRSVADELTKLAALRQQGVLSDDEFQAQKAKLLR